MSSLWRDEFITSDSKHSSQREAAKSWRALSMGRNQQVEAAQELQWWSKGDVKDHALLWAR